MLEIDVDVGRLVALARDEALEQKVDQIRVDIGDAAGNSRSTELAAEPRPWQRIRLRAREVDDVVDGEEIAARN